MADGAQSFVGTVTSFNTTKGWGFISSEESKALFGKDVFMLKTALVGGYCAQPGDQVSFTASINDRGGPEAAEVKPLAAESSGFYGQIASWNPAKGFGFISSLASNAVYGKDIFVMRTDFGPNADAVAQGMQLTFKVKTEDRGPRACEVRLLQQGGGAPGGGLQQPPPGPNRVSPSQAGFGPQRPMLRATQAGFGPKGASKGQPQRMAAAQGPFGGAMPGGRPQRAPGDNDVFFGTLKSLNLEKGWGHISCAATQKLYGKDMFALRTAFDNVVINQGDMVAFSVQQGPKGPHATKLKPVGASPEAVFRGSVTNFNAEKGWGFLDSAESQQAYGGDIFMHSREFAPGMTAPAAGDAVQFTVNIANGRAVAADVQPLGADVAADSMRFAPY